ncbi:unnamed protein product [Closterium sp. NIES-64]|nr:unnamed protein product [Closterium sp. NIES-64]
MRSYVSHLSRLITPKDAASHSISSQAAGKHVIRASQPSILPPRSHPLPSQCLHHLQGASQPSVASSGQIRLLRSLYSRVVSRTASPTSSSIGSSTSATVIAARLTLSRQISRESSRLFEQSAAVRLLRSGNLAAREVAEGAAREAREKWSHLLQGAADRCRPPVFFFPPLARTFGAASLAASKSQIAPRLVAIILGEAALRRTTGSGKDGLAHAEQMFGAAQLKSQVQAQHHTNPVIDFLLETQEAIRLALRAVYLMFLFLPAILTGPFADMAGGRFRQQWLELVHKTLECAGAAFIKWGQWAATRPDLFPKDMCAQLSKLHTKAPAHPFKTTQRIVERAFGRRLEEMFDEFDEEPVASGSIAQVHRAVLTSRYPRAEPKMVEAPRMVAVKVRHPGVREVIHRDFVIMNWVARATSLVPGLQWLRLEDSVQQFAVFMMAQVDLAREAAQLSRFNYNFRRWRSISFPKPLYPLVHPEVLVETFESGQSVSRYVDRTEPGGVVGPEGKGAWLAAEAEKAAADAAAAAAAGVAGGRVGGSNSESGVDDKRIAAASAKEGRPEGGEGVTGDREGGGAENVDDDPKAKKKRRWLVRGRPFKQWWEKRAGNKLNMELAELGSHTLLKMLLVDNFIHADLHPGNILVRMQRGHLPSAPEEGVGLSLSSHPHIVLLDVGMTAELEPRFRANMLEFFKAIAVRDGRQAAACTLKFADKQSCADPDAFIQDVDNSFKEWDATGLRIPTGDCMQDLLEHVFRVSSPFSCIVSSPKSIVP